MKYILMMLSVLLFLLLVRGKNILNLKIQVVTLDLNDESIGSSIKIYE